VEGRGVGLGPELTDVGSRRGAEFLRQALLAPGAELPKGQISPHAAFLLVNATQRDGSALVGMRIWEDAFVLQIRDVAGAYHALDKADLTSLERRFGASLMPEYAELLSDTEVTDLVAYLSSLKGNR
jgi:putative heme-binding domain-containing protein